LKKGGGSILESKQILNFTETLTKAQKTIQRAEKVMEQSAAREMMLIEIREREKDLQREIFFRKQREKMLGNILLLSNVCWIIIFILFLFAF
jgi:hypothetical protein